MTFTFESSSQVEGRLLGTKTLYIDGSKVASQEGYYQANTEDDLFIGSGGGGSGIHYHFNGALDEVRVFGVALDAATVQDVYHQVHGC